MQPSFRPSPFETDDRTDRAVTPRILLDHAAIMTGDLDASTAFYVTLIGLNLRVVEPDPIRVGRMRAMLVDSEDRDVLEIIEMTDLGHPTIPGRGGLHHLGFRLPQQQWHALRARLDDAAYPYQEVQHRLFVRDADGLVLELEQLPGV